jgi:bifunctional non-homologous end joining protein LigD
VTPLPEYIEPMLARAGPPFDSDRHLFEIKWDGTRAVAYVDESRRVRMMNRRRVNITERYPEIAKCLQRLPAGTIVDGELVVLVNGTPRFESLQKREQQRISLKIRLLSENMPATFVIFDQLYERGKSLLRMPLSDRRARLEKTISRCASDRLIVSSGIIGDGRAYFSEASRIGLEGVVAKRLDSLYLPGHRGDSWIKIKKSESVACGIMGYVPEGENDISSLILVAQNADGKLACVGKVGTGLSETLRRHLLQSLKQRAQQYPVVPTKIKGVWVEPSLCCTVRCMERTSSGVLRAPVFEALHGN